MNIPEKQKDIQFDQINIDLDKINTDRVETTKKRIVHAMNLIKSYVGNERVIPSNKVNTVINDVSHAINLLESAEKDMKYACDHFDWNDDICFLIDDAVLYLGHFLSECLYPEEELDESIIGANITDGYIILSKVIATLVRWFDDDVDCSEV